MTTSTTPTETSFEPTLPPIRSRRPAVSVDRARQIHQTQCRPSEAPDRGIGPAVLAMLLLVGALLFSQALFLRDASQILLHQRDVAPELAR